MRTLLITAAALALAPAAVFAQTTDQSGATASAGDAGNATVRHHGRRAATRARPRTRPAATPAPRRRPVGDPSASSGHHVGRRQRDDHQDQGEAQAQTEISSAAADGAFWPSRGRGPEQRCSGPFSYQSANGSRTRIVSSRSGLVETSATGQRISSSIAADVFDRLRRQLGPAARAGGRFAPARHRLVDRLDRGLVGGMRRADSRAPCRRAGSRCRSCSSSKPSSTSSLVSAMPVMPADRRRLAHQHRVEPAAAALAPGDGAELVAALAEPLADLVVQLGRERAGADARGVGLDDAEHEADRARARGPSPPAAVPATVLDEVTNG